MIDEGTTSIVCGFDQEGQRPELCVYYPPQLFLISRIQSIIKIMDWILEIRRKWLRYLLLKRVTFVRAVFQQLTCRFFGTAWKRGQLGLYYYIILPSKSTETHPTGALSSIEYFVP